MKPLRILLAASVAALSLGTGAQAADLAPGTEVTVAPAADLSSADLHKGDLFDIVTTADVLAGGQVVIPCGTHGHGRVTWRTGTGPYGKSGKMEFDAVDLMVNGQPVAVQGHFRAVGRGESGITVAAVILGGLVGGGLVWGHSAHADAETTRWAARTAQPVVAVAAYTPWIAGAGTQLASNTPPAGVDPYLAGREAGRAALLASGVER